jgi:biotin-dependent carboxylase-like uncharacterized protein
MASLHVLRAGALTTIQDGGRPGLAHLGVPHSGALDLPAYRLANRLTGNPPGTAVLETTADGVAFTCDRFSWIAVTGALAPVDVGGRAVGCGVPVAMKPGDIVNVGRALAGVRNYVAVSGGIDVAPVLGSRSTDILAGVGPPIIRDGDVLSMGRSAGSPPAMDFALYSHPPKELRLVVHLGPRDDWLAAGETERLRGFIYLVSSNSNRIAMRLEGPPLSLSERRELPSEGLVLGAVQVPPDGRPLVFLADHPTTGGYPVIGVLDEEGIARCAQAGPGTTVMLHTRQDQIVDGV